MDSYGSLCRFHLVISLGRGVSVGRLGGDSEMREHSRSLPEWLPRDCAGQSFKVESSREELQE